MTNPIRAVLLILSCAFGSATALASCPTAPLSVYLTPGFTCTANIFTFKDFVFDVDAGGLTPDQITVTPIEDPIEIGFRFTGAFAVIAGRQLTYNLNYFVDPAPVIIRGEQIATDLGLLQTTVCSPGAEFCVELTATPDHSDTVIFPILVNTLSVQNMLTLSGVLKPNGPAHAPAGPLGFLNLTFLQGPAAIASETQGVYQLRYFANLQRADSYIVATNAGTVSGLDPNGRICANIYVFDPSEELVSCCSCLITPNGLVSLSARNDLLNNTLTGAPLTSGVTVKVLASLPIPVGGTVCDPSSPNAGNLVSGLKIWGVTPHGNTALVPPPPAGSAFRLTETEFIKAELSAAELTKLTGFCRFVQVVASGFGQCKSCPTLGAQGANQK